jgi:hypothetical protein
VPLDLVVYAELLQIYYDNALAGHFSEKKILDLLLCKYYWPSINVDIVNYISTCDLCQCMRVL